MPKELKFSVTIPAYKDNYLKETIDTILTQIYYEHMILIAYDSFPYYLEYIFKIILDKRYLHCFIKNIKNHFV